MKINVKWLWSSEVPKIGHFLLTKLQTDVPIETRVVPTLYWIGSLGEVIFSVTFLI